MQQKPTKKFWRAYHGLYGTQEQAKIENGAYRLNDLDETATLLPVKNLKVTTDSQLGFPVSAPKPKKYPEQAMQIAVVTWASHHPICRKYLIHIANERKCSPKQGERLRRMGVKRGVFDLLLAYPKNGYAGLWIELKVGKNKVSEFQQEWQELMKGVGYATAVVYDDWTKVKTVIEDYLR